MNATRVYRLLTTPTGPFAIIREPDGSLRTTWTELDPPVDLSTACADPDLEPRLARKLIAYFAGDSVCFADVPLPPASDFVAGCRRACQDIPAGQTATYGQIAEAAGGTRSAARAVGQVMRSNPLPIVVPCHRVVAAGGKLGGFAGADDATAPSMRLKRFLLAHEARLSPASPIETDTAHPLFAATR